MRSRGLVGAALGAGGFALATSPMGGALWAAAVLVACSGYGALVERLVHKRQSNAMLVVSGLAVVLAISTLLARAGILFREVQLGVVGIGLVACSLPRLEGDAPRIAVPRAALIFVICGAAMLVGIELVHPGAPFCDEEVNHVVAVKHLWDTGSLPPIAHQFGAQIVGESYFALSTGAHTAALFDGGICVALMLLVLAECVASDGVGLVVFVMLALPIILNPEPRSAELPQWGMTLLHFAAWSALRNQQRAVTVIIAIGLAMMRHEAIVIAAPYVVAAAISAPRKHARWITLGFAGGLVVLALVLHGSIVLSLLPLFAVPGAALVVWMLRPQRIYDAFAVLAAAVIGLSLARVGAIPVAARGSTTTFAAWYVLAAAILVEIDARVFDRARLGEARVWLPTSLLVTAIFLGVTVLGPNVSDRRRERMRTRFTYAFHDLDQVRSAGYDLGSHRDARALEHRVPEGSRVGFWGQSGAFLDFTHAHVRDVSFGGKRGTTFLAPLEEERVRDLDFVIIETVLRPMWSAWDDGNIELVFEPSLLGLTPVARSGSLVLYRRGV